MQSLSELGRALAAASMDLPAGHPATLTIEQARMLCLGPWCYWSAQAGSPWRHGLAADFAHEWQRQERRAAALIPLFRAWDALGVAVYAFKGLAMAWAVYPHPAARYAGDVDLLISPEDALRARQVSVPGWELVESTGLTCDIAFYLFCRELGLLVEVHDNLAPNACLGVSRSRDLTQKMIGAARCSFKLTAGHAAVDVRTLDPADLVLAMVINRSWSSDAWRSKPHDYLDIHYGQQKWGVTADRLQQRANDLGLGSTWLHFSRDCNPFTGRLDLVSPRLSPWRRLRKHLAIWSGGVPPYVRTSCLRLGRGPALFFRSIRTMPAIAGVLRDLRAHPAPQVVAAKLKVRDQGGHRRWRPWQAEQAVRWAIRMLGPLSRLTSAGPCVVQSLALYRLLQADGHACEWFLGYRPGESGLPVGHAWVDCPGGHAFGLAHGLKNQQYRIIFRTTEAGAADFVRLP